VLVKMNDLILSRSQQGFQNKMAAPFSNKMNQTNCPARIFVLEKSGRAGGNFDRPAREYCFAS
jgi:hypothetical protein